MTKEDDELMKAIADHMKEAFCADGNVEFDSLIFVESKSGEELKGILFKLEDSHRGTFYTAILHNELLKISVLNLN